MKCRVQLVINKISDIFSILSFGMTERTSKRTCFEVEHDSAISEGTAKAACILNIQLCKTSKKQGGWEAGKPISLEARKQRRSEGVQGRRNSDIQILVDVKQQRS